MSDKNVRKLAMKLELPIKKILVRGGTDHRKDLFLEDGTVLCYWPDGTIKIWGWTTWVQAVKDPTIPEECRG